MANHSDGVPVVSTPSSEAPQASAVPHHPPAFYQQFLSETGKARKPSPIRGLYPLEATPGMISLLAGKPNATTFPITGITLQTLFPPTSPPDPSVESAPNIFAQARPAELVVEPAHVAAGLQYGPTAGFPPLLEWLGGLQEKEHGRMPKVEGWRMTMGAGSQDLIYKAANAILNPGDPVLVESPAYAGVIPLFSAFGPLHEVATDAHGISSAALRNILESWPSDKPKPKLLYTTPYGCNPTGMTATLERRKEVLQLAEEHNFLILEDDPYYYLYYGPTPRPPSYFALEPSILPAVGRVLRADSLSKILSAGLRVGFFSGPQPIVDVMDTHTALANLQSPGLTQSIAFTLLNAWGYPGFVNHTRAVSAFYRARRDVFDAAMHKHMAGLAEWVRPEAGMFFWFKLLLPPADGAAAGGDGDSAAVVREHAVRAGVLALPGTAFMVDGRRTAHVRASFSLLDGADVDEAVRRLAGVVRAAQGGA